MSTPVSNKPDPAIRRARVEDASLLAELGARTFAESFATANTPEDMAAYLASSFGAGLQAAELADPSSVFLIAEIAGVPAGYAKLHRGETPAAITNDKPIELVRLYATKEWLGCGVGAALMRACLSEALQRGCRTLWLGVWEHNIRARAFYRRWNFLEVGTHIFQLGDDSQTDVLMERSIEEREP